MNWFSLSSTVNRGTYIAVGWSLAIVKYVIECVAVYVATGTWFSPTDFVNPWLNSKAPFLIDAPAAGLVWLAFTIPFVWIAIAMSVRRAADVGLSRWFGLLVLIPIVNLMLMLVLACLPTGWLRRTASESAEDEAHREELASAFRPTPAMIEVNENPIRAREAPVVAAMLMGTFTLVSVGAISVWLLQLYGFVLFFSAPVVAGAVSGFVYNRRQTQGSMALLGIIVLSNVLSYAIMLAVGIDGAICLAMAFPLLIPLSFLGGLVGRAVATAGIASGHDETRGMYGIMIALPLALSLESLDGPPPLHRVTTSVEIDAPPAVVWQQVIAFPEIEETPAWFFRLGIAAPVRAHIVGQGVGAVRQCEFTTGPFVEPITVWEPPHRLAFDVVSQPQPMKEWSPFPHLHPPHLDHGFVSRRGEFRLEALADGRTSLHGSTWYQIDVRPRLYWKAWADPTIHAIHRRVLDHIARCAESE